MRNKITAIAQLKRGEITNDQFHATLNRPTITHEYIIQVNRQEGTIVERRAGYRAYTYSRDTIDEMDRTIALLVTAASAQGWTVTVETII